MKNRCNKYFYYLIITAFIFIIYFPLFYKGAHLYTVEDINYLASTINQNFIDILRFFIGDHCWGAVTNINFFRPIVRLQFHIIYSLFGITPYALHIQHFILLIITAFLLYFLVKNIFQNKKIALYSTIFFIIFPANPRTYYFANNSGDPLTLFFFLLTILTHQKKFPSIIVIISMLTAFGSKEHAYILPAIIILYDIIISKISFINTIKKNFILITVAVVFYIYRIILFNGLGGYGKVHLPDSNFIINLINKIYLVTSIFGGRYFFLFFIIILLLAVMNKRTDLKFRNSMRFIFCSFIISFTAVLNMDINNIQSLHDLIIAGSLFSILLGALFYNIRNIFKSRIYFKIMLTSVIIFISLKTVNNCIFWYRRALPRQKIIDNVKLNILKSSADKVLIILPEEIRHCGDNIELENIEPTIELTLQNTLPKKYYSLYDFYINNIPIDNTDIFILNINDYDLYPVSYNGLLSHYKNASEYKKIQSFISDNINLNYYDILHIIATKNPAIYNLIFNELDLKLFNKHKHMILEYIAYHYSNHKIVNYKLWNEFITNPTLQPLNDLFFLNILYNSLFDNTHKIDLNKIANIHKTIDHSQNSKHLISYILFSADKISAAEFISSLPAINNSPELKFLLFDSIIFYNADKKNILNDIFKYKYIINNFSDILFIYHYKLKKIMYPVYKQYYARFYIRQ